MLMAGINPIRMMSSANFEEVYENDFGLVAAYLGISNYGIFGATPEGGGSVLEVFIDLDLVADSYTTADWGLQLSADLGDKLSALFDIFYDHENAEEFRENSQLHQSFQGIAVMPWLTPEIIIINMALTVNGESRAYTVMDNSATWESETEIVLETGLDYLDHCRQKYVDFMAAYQREFNDEGNYVGRQGEVKMRGYNPKNR